MEVATTTSPKTLSNENLSRSVVKQVADREGVEPSELSQPLYSAIDPEALDSLFHSTTADDSQTPGHVRFTYLGYEIRVRSDGEITLTED